MSAFCGVIWCSFGFMISQKSIFSRCLGGRFDENFEQNCLCFLLQKVREEKRIIVLYHIIPGRSKKVYSSLILLELTYSLL